MSFIVLTKKTLSKTVSLLLLPALLSCGGGGTNEDPATAAPSPFTNNRNTSDFSITFTPDMISHESQSGIASSGVVTAVATGDPGVTEIHAYVSEPSGVLTSMNVFFSDVSEPWLSYNINESLWAGTYTGSIHVDVCADADCNTHLAASPYAIPYSVVVTPRYWRAEVVSELGSSIKYSDSNSLVVYVEAGSAPLSVDIRTEVGDSVTDFQLPNTMIETFSIQNYSKTGFTLEFPALEPGEYSFDYYLTDGGDEDGFRQDFGIYYVVSPEGVDIDTLAFDRETLHYRIAVNSFNVPSTNVSFYKPYNNTSFNLVHADIEYLDGDAWLSLLEDAVSGNEFVIEPKINDLNEGNYSAVVTARNGANLSDRLTVELELFRGIYSGYFAHYFSGYDIGYPGLHEITLHNSDDASIGWRAVTSSPLIELADSDGTFVSDSGLTFGFNYEAIAELPNNSSGSAKVLVSAEDNIYPPETIDIFYSKNFPEITRQSLMAVAVGQPFELLLEGVNFNWNMGVILIPQGSEDPMNQQIWLAAELSDDGKTYTVNHSGINFPGVYEIEFEHDANRALNYQTPFVPRATLIVTE